MILPADYKNIVGCDVAALVGLGMHESVTHEYTGLGQKKSVIVTTSKNEQRCMVQINH